MLLQIAYARLIFRIRAGLCGGGLLETTARPAHLATALVRLNVDLIVTWFTSAAQAAKGATREIPIVMAFTGNPIETGLVESLNRPGREHRRHGRGQACIRTISSPSRRITPMRSPTC
jgi:hypothetical protein